MKSKEFILNNPLLCHKIKPGDIFCTGNPNVIGRLIKLKSKAEYAYADMFVNHIGISRGGYTSLEARWWVGRFNIKDYFDNKSSLVIFRDTRLDDKHRNILSVNIDKIKFRFYDFLGILGQTISYFTKIEYFERLQDKHAFFCSELVATLYKESFGDLLKISDKEFISYIDPQDIYMYMRADYKSFKPILTIKEGDVVWFNQNGM